MKLLCLSAASLLAYLPCFAQNEDVAKENFLFPDDFALTLSTVEGSSESTEIRASWPAIPNALVYEVELAELYVEGIFPTATALKLEGNTITGLGTGDGAGNLQVGFHVQIKGSANGNDGTYIVAKEGLTENSLTVSGAELKTETLETSKADILRIDPAQWDYFVQKKALFATDEPALHFTGLSQGAPYIARIRAVTEGDHLVQVLVHHFIPIFVDAVFKGKGWGGSPVPQFGPDKANARCADFFHDAQVHSGTESVGGGQSQFGLDA